MALFRKDQQPKHPWQTGQAPESGEVTISAPKASELAGDVATEQVVTNPLDEQQGTTEISDGWDTTPRPNEVPSPAEYDKDNGIERAGRRPVDGGHQVNLADQIDQRVERELPPSTPAA